MLNKKLCMIAGMVALVIGISPARAEDAVVEEVDVMEQISAKNVADYNPDGSLFEQITTLEQEKVLMQLEKERAQLDLELDRLAAEKIKLHMEIDELSGRADNAKQELETEKARLAAEAERLTREKEKLESQVEERSSQSYTAVSENTTGGSLSDAYRLVNVIGAGAQLQATVENLSSGQTKRISVGKTLDGYTVKSISLDDGVVFEKDGEIQNLNIKSNM